MRRRRQRLDSSTVDILALGLGFSMAKGICRHISLTQFTHSFIRCMRTRKKTPSSMSAILGPALGLVLCMCPHNRFQARLILIHSLLCYLTAYVDDMIVIIIMKYPWSVCNISSIC